MRVKTDDWGEILLKKISSPSEFWTLYDELLNDEKRLPPLTGFRYNRASLLQAFQDGNLYGLFVATNESMKERNALSDPIFAKQSREFYANDSNLLPCFCIKREKAVFIIWTHTRARRMGLARKLIEYLDLREALYPLPDSFPFWRRCGFVETPDPKTGKITFKK